MHILPILALQNVVNHRDGVAWCEHVWLVDAVLRIHKYHTVMFPIQDVAHIYWEAIQPIVVDFPRTCAVYFEMP